MIRSSPRTSPTSSSRRGGWTRAIGAAGRSVGRIGRNGFGPIAAALEVERERTAEVVAQALAEVVADEREAAAQTWRDQVRGLRADLARTEAVLEQLRRLVEIERHKVLDLPALPLSRRDIN